MARRLRPLTVVMLAVGLVFVAITVVYLATQCQHLPAPLPGKETGSTRHRVGYAAVAFAAALLAFLAAFFTRRPRLTRS